MRGLRSTILFVVVLAGLGAYYYFVTAKLPEGGSDAKKQQKVFDGVDSAKLMLRQNQLFRRLGMRSFPGLLMEVTRDPAMVEAYRSGTR